MKKVNVWGRALVICLVGTLLNLFADYLLKVQVGSGRDHLLYITIVGLLSYAFIWQPLKRSWQAEIDNKHH